MGEKSIDLEMIKNYLVEGYRCFVIVFAANRIAVNNDGGHQKNKIN